MKTIKQLIESIQIVPGNLEHIAETGKINGSLYMSIENAIRTFVVQEMEEYREVVESYGNHNHPLFPLIESGTNITVIENPSLEKGKSILMLNTEDYKKAVSSTKK